MNIYRQTPKKPGKDPAVILEFKVRSTRKENSLEETAQSALAQIKDRKYSRNWHEWGGIA